ncbi:MAG: hypothetical protein R3B93_04395 [Bacteroidia bacterium]
MGSNEFGCLDTAFLNVEVVQAPPLTVTASKASICAGERSILTASGAIQYQWENAPGLTRTRGAEVVVTPNQDQVYRVSGQDARGCISNGEIKVTVSRSGRPFANFKADKTDICAGQSVQYTSLSQNAVDFRWEFPGGTPSASTDPNPLIKYNSEGVKDVILNVRGCGGTTDRKEELGVVIVTAPINLSLNVAAEMTACKDQPIVMRARGANRYEWSPALGLDQANRAQVQATPQVSTTYTVTGFNSEGCHASETVNINVIGEGNHVKITPFAPVICKGEKVSLRASEQPAINGLLQMD